MTTEATTYNLDINETLSLSPSTSPLPETEPLLTFPPYFQLLIYILYNLIFITAVIGNLLVIYVVTSSPRMRTVTNYLIANLALGDLLMALLCVPFSYISVLWQYWPFGEILCHLVSPAQATCVFVSAYTLIVLAVDRYIAILYPLRPRLERGQALWIIAGVWVIAVITASPIAVFTRLEMDEGRGLPLCEESAWSSDTLRLAYSLTLMTLQYFFPISVLIFTYTRIAIAVWGKKAPGEAEDNRDQRLARSKRKMIKMMLTVVVIYTVSWLPFNCLIILLNTVPQQHSLFTTTLSPTNLAFTYFLFHFLAISHTVINPIIYCGMNSTFRQGFAVATRKIPCLSKLFYNGGNDMRFQRSGTVSYYTTGHANHCTGRGGHRGTNNINRRNTNGAKTGESFL